MQKIRYIFIFFLLLITIHSNFAGQSIIPQKISNVGGKLVFLADKRLESLDKVKVETKFEAVSIKTALFYFAHILKENKIDNVKMILLSEFDLDNQTTVNSMLDTKITADVHGMSFLKALEFICQKAQMEYVINEGTIIIGSRKVLQSCSK